MILFDNVQVKGGRSLETSLSNGFCYTAIFFVKDRILLSYQSGGRDTTMVLDRNRVRLLDLEWVYKQEM